MPASFAATYGFRPPSAAEQAALAQVRAYLRRVENELASRGWTEGLAGPAGGGRTAGATGEALRACVQSAGAFCDGLLEAIAAAPAGGAGAGRPPGA
jgi:hypothetical protein